MSDDQKSENTTPKMPDSTAPEWAITAIEAGMSAGASFIPGVGGILSAAAIVLARTLSRPIEKREQAYVESIAAGVESLRSHVAEIDQRLTEDSFITAFLRAGHISLRSHQHEKLQALQNAVLNVAAGTAPDDDTQLILLNLLDAISPTHVRLLQIFVNPAAYGIMGGVSRLYYPGENDWNEVQKAVPSLHGQRETYHMYVNDLVNRGLLTRANTNPTVPPRDLLESMSQHPTGLAYQFLRFITSPLLESDTVERQSTPGESADTTLRAPSEHNPEPPC